MGPAREGSAESTLQARTPPDPAPASPRGACSPGGGGPSGVLPPVESARMPITQAGPEIAWDVTYHVDTALDCLLGGSCGVGLERWTFLNPQREKLWVLDRGRPEFKDRGHGRSPEGLGTPFYGTGTGCLPCGVVKSVWDGLCGDSSATG